MATSLPLRCAPASGLHTHEEPHMSADRILDAFPYNPTTDWNKNEEFFNFTRGRFVCNEAMELALRQVRFDMNELARVAARAVGSQRCVTVEKYPDGTFNKAFLMTMEDGKEAVAKVPTRNAGQAHFTIASEVATMEFARTVLKNPVPKVLEWSSRAEFNAVGAEYIIMEKVNGIPLDHVWARLGMEQKLEIIKSIARCQKNWMRANFSQFGSLYFTQDLENGDGVSYTDAQGSELTDDRFSIGPSVGRHCFDDGRAEISFDRGPCKHPFPTHSANLLRYSLGRNVEEYVLAIGNREVACIANMERLPKSPLTLPGPYARTRAKKLAALQINSQLAKYLLPTDPALLSSNIWHSDLHGENILVNPDNPTEVVGIIDWQSIQLVPLYENGTVPSFLHYDGPEVKGIERPKCPDTSEMDSAARASAMTLWVQMLLVACYRKLISARMPTLYRALEFCDTTFYNLLLFPQNFLLDGETTYQWTVGNKLEQCWPSVPRFEAYGSPAFPIKFSAEERKQIEDDHEAANKGQNYLSDLRDRTGLDLISTKGLVCHSDYEYMKDILREEKEVALREFATTEDERKLVEEGWPFDD
ncbi:Altered inheritance of mitochondria protein, mitochondrial [Lachnellula willkommii]|uniref:Altered inheritance of mitochondria protein, mitochondrial n=1 Tax=Lachnellula willkommii TaxID=215461 RepID=A0A559M4A2_9HELO|nr:Altered inheritance of mitochondria protein, mitochondrial [Lachnellula willkommii]